MEHGVIGNTTDFDSVVRGSNPRAPANFDGEKMKNENMVVYSTIDVVVKIKINHQKRRFMNKRNKHTGVGFCLDYGDIPAWTYNDITNKTEPVLNTRGVAYAHRNALRYKKNKRDLI